MKMWIRSNLCLVAISGQFRVFGYTRGWIGYTCGWIGYTRGWIGYTCGWILRFCQPSDKMFLRKRSLHDCDALGSPAGSAAGGGGGDGPPLGEGPVKRQMSGGVQRWGSGLT